LFGGGQLQWVGVQPEPMVVAEVKAALVQPEALEARA